MILNLNKQAQDAFAAVDALGNTLKYGSLLDFSESISTILPSRSLLFLLTENNARRYSLEYRLYQFRQCPFNIECTY